MVGGGGELVELVNRLHYAYNYTIGMALTICSMLNQNAVSDRFKFKNNWKKAGDDAI